MALRLESPVNSETTDFLHKDIDTSLKPYVFSSIPQNITLKMKERRGQPDKVCKNGAERQM